MSTQIDIRDLPARWMEALALVSSGREVILMDGLTPQGRLLPWSGSPMRVAGLHTGAIQTGSDFDAPLPDDFWTGQT